MDSEISSAICPKKNRRYINPHVGKLQSHPLHVFLWKLGWFDDPRELSGAPFEFKYPVFPDAFDPNLPSATWINHDTFLLSYKGRHILTDPIWSFRCSPVPFVGPKRFHPPSLELQSLPKIDCVIISHDHYDHLDKRTVKALHKLQPHIWWVVPHGVRKWMHRKNIKNVVELSWWEEHRFLGDIPFKVTAVPAQHFSGRGFFDVNKTLWMGAVIEFEKDKKVYFAGDTGYNPVHFKEIGAKWNGFDLSLLPIGSYIPRKFMSPVHADPHGSVLIHKEVRSKFSVGMHWKTFDLGDESLHQPPYDLFLALQKEGIDPKDFRVIEPGHALNW